MNKLSIFTTMTNPSERNDPWKEALNCYEDLADEVIIVGEDWPYEFRWDHIGKTFQEGFDRCQGEWVIRMDLDYFFHEKDFSYIKKILQNNTDSPAIAFPQYQFFTPDRFQVKTKICIALNKKYFPSIKLNGGGDLCLPTINNKLILNNSVPQSKKPVYQYDSIFRTKDIISRDRARFARAWFSYFNDWGDRGGPTENEAFDAWYEMIKKRYKHHTNKLIFRKHPSYINERLDNLEPNQFGFDAFGLKNKTKRELYSYLKGYKNRFLD
tara:strand:- start:314 stop:1117 length:804 start_codon:yes stop_codon:yes gene_type:complete